MFKRIVVKRDYGKCLHKILLSFILLGFIVVHFSLLFDTMLVFAFLLLPISTLWGHGNMIRPRTWFNPEGTDGNHVGCGVQKDWPHTEFEDVLGEKPDCMNFW